MRDRATIRIRIITAGVLIVACILVGRLYHLQVYNGHVYAEEGRSQYVHTVRDLYSRGSIFFTTKDNELVSAATVRGGYVLAINPQMITDPEYVYEQLKSFIELDKELFLARARNTDRVYVEIDQRVTEAVAESITELNLDGVQLYRNKWRYYPGGDLSSRVIGFVGHNNNELSGRYGLERHYDDILTRSEERLAVNFFAEMFETVQELVFDEKETRQGDIVTTIEPTVSRYLQNKLEEVQDQWGSKTVGGVIINPQNGEIYALSSTPGFDLNDRAGVTIEDFRNPIIENVYEMGSIVKALTVAAGLDSGAITAKTTYYDGGSIDLNTFTIRNFDGRGRGTVDMQEVLNQSLNTGVAYIVDAMGKDAFRDYFNKLKIGSETGIDLPGEAHGLVRNLESPRDVEYATASFGQGIALTPIAMTRALSTLGNGGVMITPHIAKEIRFLDGEVQPILYPEGEQVFSAETSEEISRMLTGVVDDALRNGTVKLDNYSVAAKTGTAQIADRENGGYYEDRFLHSFFGYFPSYDPTFLVFLYTVEPKGVRYASETLTEPFIDITQFLINYYSVPPDR